MKTFKLHREIVIPRRQDEVFEFFAETLNLGFLTPDWLHFQVVTPQPIAVRQGTEIEYRLRLHGVPIRWTSRITVWQPPHLFVDEQVRGPYRVWIHEHRFRPVTDGTLVEDRVHYSVWGGTIVDRLMVAPDLARVFDYRSQRLLERFPSRPNVTN